MRCAKRDRNQRHANVQEVSELSERTAKVTAIFRLADDTVCHARCGRALSYQGMRGLIEADFYCYTCVTHVTIPLTVLQTLPVMAEAGASMAGAAL